MKFKMRNGLNATVNLIERPEADEVFNECAGQNFSLRHLLKEFDCVILTVSLKEATIKFVFAKPQLKNRELACNLVNGDCQ